MTRGGQGRIGCCVQSACCELSDVQTWAYVYASATIRTSAVCSAINVERFSWKTLDFSWFFFSLYLIQRISHSLYSGVSLFFLSYIWMLISWPSFVFQLVPCYNGTSVELIQIHTDLIMQNYNGLWYHGRSVVTTDLMTVCQCVSSGEQCSWLSRGPVIKKWIRSD